jgi:c(7)-type cytochrome triheme protein
MTVAQKKNRVKIVCLLAALAIFAVSCLRSDRSAQKADPAITAVERFAANNVPVSAKNYSRFSHTVAEHKAIACDSCHRRDDNSITPKFAGHSSCIDCHLPEFVNSQSNMCVICHTNSPENPAEMRAFPAKFNESFNMKFDHAVHSRGNALPREGCAACHAPMQAGRMQSIPAGINTHAQCFTCHTNDSAIGSCNECHSIVPYSRTVAKSAIIKAVFSHADHTANQGLRCADCHSARPGAPQGKQISAPAAVQHFPGQAAKGTITCAQCHNDKRAFGEVDFANCRRCHAGPGFDMLTGQ